MSHLRSRTPGRTGRLLLLLLLAVALAACAPARSTPVVMDDFTFTPDRIEIPADTDGWTLAMSNVATQPHDFTVEGLPEGVPMHLLLFEDAADVPYIIPPVPAGTYPVYCSLPGHRGAGMEATLVVE
ncbi:MAG: plastocyanin [Nitriliruptoraceae bacterium]|jgi:plastocyanin